jgi:DHA2 family multidrug resistance protein-like MFS transporter
MGSFALTVGTFILVSGKLGDIFGLKLIFCIGWFWIAISSLITGLSVYSDSVVFFIICRAIQGIGFALLLPCGMGILGTVYSNGTTRKNLVFGLVGVNGPVGATICAIMAAVIGQLWWWPWCFWLLAIVCFGCGIASIMCIPDITKLQFRHLNDPGDFVKTPKFQFDFLGSSLGISGLILFNFVWNQGPVAGWNKAYIITLLVVAMLLIVAFFFVELKVAKYPLLPKSIFTFKIGLVLLCISLGWGSFGVWQYYYWQFMFNLRHYTPIYAALTYIPFLIGGTVASLLVSAIISITKPSYIISFASICFMCGCIMMSVAPIDQSYFQVTLGQQVILCWAMDLSFPAAAIILSNYLPVHHQGMAGSLVSTVINYSVSLFLGIGSVVEFEVMQNTGKVWFSYQSALRFGIGVAGLGVIFSLIFIAVQRNDEVGTFKNEIDTVDEKKSFLRKDHTIP